jgi:hypothetical protein
VSQPQANSPQHVEKPRLKYVIDPVFQFNFAGVTVLLVLGFALLVGAFTFAKLGSFLDLVYDQPEATDAVRKLAKLQINDFTFWLMTMILGYSFAALFVIVALTHRVAGAKFAIVRHVRSRLMAGEFDRPLKLRKHDYLKDVAEAINELSAQIQATIDESEAERRSAPSGVSEAS